MFNSNKSYFFFISTINDLKEINVNGINGVNKIIFLLLYVYAFAFEISWTCIPHIGDIKDQSNG